MDTKAGVDGPKYVILFNVGITLVGSSCIICKLKI